MHGWMHEWMTAWMNEWMNEWMQGWMNVWVNKLMNALMHVPPMVQFYTTECDFWLSFRPATGRERFLNVSKIRQNWMQRSLIDTFSLKSCFTSAFESRISFTQIVLNVWFVRQSSQPASSIWPTLTTTTLSTWPRSCWQEWSRVSSGSIR